MLEVEKERFEELQPSLLPEFSGQIAVVHGKELVGIYPTIEAAYADAATKLGLQSVLVRKIGEPEQVASIPALALGVLRADNSRSTSR